MAEVRDPRSEIRCPMLLIRGTGLQQEALDGAARRDAMAEEPRRKHACVVGYQHVAAAQVVRQIPNRCMAELAGDPSQDEQPRLSAAHRVLRNQLSRKEKIERVDFHPSLPTIPSPIAHRPSAIAAAPRQQSCSTAQIVMADTPQPTGTRGIEPAKDPIAPTEGAPGEPPPVVVDVEAPVGVRNLPLAVLAVIATILLLQYASTVFIPIVIAILISYSLTPSVTSLQKRGIPPAVGAAVVLM